MKKILFLLALIMGLHSLSTIAQSGTYTSKIGANTYVSIELIYDGNVVTAIRSNISPDPSITSGVYNLAGFISSDNRKFNPPSPGTYWAIPFDFNLPLQTVEEDFCFDCICSMNSGGGGWCQVQWSTSGQYMYCHMEDGCECCDASFTLGTGCGGAIMVGGGIVLAAERVNIVNR